MPIKSLHLVLVSSPVSVKNRQESHRDDQREGDLPSPYAKHGMKYLSMHCHDPRRGALNGNHAAGRNESPLSASGGRWDGGTRENDEGFCRLQLKKTAWCV